MIKCSALQNTLGRVTPIATIKSLTVVYSLNFPSNSQGARVALSNSTNMRKGLTVAAKPARSFRASPIATTVETVSHHEVYQRVERVAIYR